MSARKRMKLALFLGASALNFSNTPLNVATVASNTFRGIFSASLPFPPGYGFSMELQVEHRNSDSASVLSSQFVVFKVRVWIFPNLGISFA